MTLTHQLKYNAKHERWACHCGYVLGRDGRRALYARCKLFNAKQSSLSSNKAKLPISYAKKKHPTKKVQRQTNRPGAGISQKALDLFTF